MEGNLLLLTGVSTSCRSGRETYRGTAADESLLSPRPAAHGPEFTGSAAPENPSASGRRGDHPLKRDLSNRQRRRC
jgi:hypothetical protein